MAIQPSIAPEKAQEFYVYELWEEDDEIPFYVGKGTGDRMYIHERYPKSDPNPQKVEKIRKIRELGKQVVKRKVFVTPSEQYAFIYEWVLIHLVYGIENLTNIKEGYREKAPLPQGPFPATHLRTYRINLSWSISKLAREAHLSFNPVKHAEVGKRVTAQTAKAIADALSKAAGQEIKPSDIEGLVIG